MNSNKNNYLMSIYVDNTKLLNNTIIGLVLVVLIYLLVKYYL